MNWNINRIKDLEKRVWEATNRLAEGNLTANEAHLLNHEAARDRSWLEEAVAALPRSIMLTDEALQVLGYYPVADEDDHIQYKDAAPTYATGRPPFVCVEKEKQGHGFLWSTWATRSMRMSDRPLAHGVGFGDLVSEVKLWM